MNLRKATKSMEDYKVFDSLYYQTEYSFELGKISEIRSEPNPIDPAPNYEEYCMLLDQKNTSYFMLENDKKEIVASVILYNAGEYLKIEDLVVCREEQHKGIGRILYKLIENKARSQKRKFIILSCQFAGAIEFWKKMGFEKKNTILVKKL